ncbi:MAG: DUF3135 domain-containing protein [Betaproteobacteria bacterium]|nr:DUF3135 domain-containing protein [Betaproteobacteria bacterium]
MSDEVSSAFDSEEWMALARSDPEQFEKRRAQAIDEVINSAPAHIQRRLRGLQWRIDLERSRAGTPLGACVRLYSMMWDFVCAENGFLAALKGLSEDRPWPGRRTTLARVIAFPSAAHRCCGRQE